MFYFLKRKLINFLPSILLLILINNKILINGQGSLSSVEYNRESSKGGGLSALLASKKASSGSGSGEIVKAASLSLHEPSCEELRAMWQFSKRQSRASEITNEIPTYHDPFAYNIWDPTYYPTTTRSMGGRRINGRYRDGNARPVYGRVVIKPSAGRFQEIPAALERPRATYDEYRPFESSLMGGNRKQQSPEAAQTRRRQQPKSRNGFIGYGSAAAASSNIHVPQTIYGTSNPTPNSNLISPQRGSFARLKQLVWTERARELEEQRKKESVAARAAILKDITNGQHYKTSLSSSSPSSSSSSSTSSASSTRKPKQGGGLNNNNNNNGGSSKNKLLRNENKGRFDSSKDDNMQFVANPSPYWSTNDNVKRSSISLIQQQADQQYPDDVSMKDYYGDLSAPANLNGDEMIYFDDDGDDDNDEASNYDLNAYFNRINQDNINDFYYEINQLLSRKPNQK